MEPDRRPAADDRERDTRTVFERFVEIAQGVVARPQMLVVVFLLVAIWIATYPLFHHAADWLATLHTLFAVISLALLVLLENAGRRDAQAAQEKLNVMSEALVALLEAQAAASPGAGHGPELGAQADRLRTAVGLEDRH